MVSQKNYMYLNSSLKLMFYYVNMIIRKAEFLVNCVTKFYLLRLSTLSEVLVRRDEMKEEKGAENR